MQSLSGQLENTYKCVAAGELVFCSNVGGGAPQGMQIDWMFTQAYRLLTPMEQHGPAFEMLCAKAACQGLQPLIVSSLPARMDSTALRPGPVAPSSGGQKVCQTAVTQLQVVEEATLSVGNTHAA